MYLERLNIDYKTNILKLAHKVLFAANLIKNKWYRNKKNAYF